MPHAHLNVPIWYQADPRENSFILLWCYYLSYRPGLWFCQHRAILYIRIITPSLMKLLTSPLAIVLAGKRPCLSALEEPGNRGVIILGGSLWERLWLSGDRTQNLKTKKKRKGWNHSTTALSRAGIHSRVSSLVLTNSKQKGISETSMWHQIGLGVHID